jgi:hypothetical protein
MIELVARAINPLAWERLGNGFERRASLNQARNAMLAMREPNLNMCNTAYDIVCWKRMIDAAMKE